MQHSLTTEQERAVNVALRLFFTAVATTGAHPEHADKRAEARRLLANTIDRWHAAGGALDDILPGIGSVNVEYLRECILYMTFPSVVTI